MIDFLTKPLPRESLAKMLQTGVPKEKHGMTAAEARKVHLQGRHILLVEDSAVNRMVIEEVLRQLGCRVTVANNGHVALLAAQSQRDIDLTLMDGHMPGMDGFAATRELREMEKSGLVRPTPIIALTALATSGDRERCLEGGMDDYLAKPARKDDLVAMLIKWLLPEALSETTGSAREVTYVDRQARDDLLTAFGTHYDQFMLNFFADTESRLRGIGKILAGGGERKTVALHAHSISSSSAYAGAMHLCDLSRALEQKAGEENAGTEDLAALYADIQVSFTATRRALEEDQLKDRTAAAPMKTAITVPMTEAAT